MKIGFLSDMHISYNRANADAVVYHLIKMIEDNDLSYLIIAGDVSENPKDVEFLANHVNNFFEERKVYYIFGNHEYWGINKYDDPWDDESYIDGKVLTLNEDTVLVASDGWADLTFVTEVDNLQTKLLPKDTHEILSAGQRNFDLRRIAKGEEYLESAKKSIDLFKKTLESVKDKKIIAVTHYVPHRNFLSYRDSTWTLNNAFMGSVRYEEFAKEFNITHWVFGHTHSIYNEVIDGVSYHCNPMGYDGRDRIWSQRFTDEMYDRLKIIEI